MSFGNWGFGLQKGINYKKPKKAFKKGKKYQDNQSVGKERTYIKSNPPRTKTELQQLRNELAITRKYRTRKLLIKTVVTTVIVIGLIVFYLLFLIDLKWN